MMVLNQFIIKDHSGDQAIKSIADAAASLLWEELMDGFWDWHSVACVVLVNRYEYRFQVQVHSGSTGGEGFWYVSSDIDPRMSDVPDIVAKMASQLHTYRLMDWSEERAKSELLWKEFRESHPEEFNEDGEWIGPLEDEILGLSGN